MSPTRHPYFAGMLGCGILLGLLALQATPAAGSSFSIYVVNAFDNNVVVFNSDTQKVVTTFPVGRAPEGIAITPDGSRVYVVNFVDNNVALPLPLATLFIPVGPGPEGIA